MKTSILNRRSFIASSAALLTAAAYPSFTQAQEFPSQQFRIISGFAPGGVTDVYARLLAQYLQETFGQPAIVENQTGAGGLVAMGTVDRAPADGYTLLVSAAAQIVALPAASPNLSVDPINGFAHVSAIANTNLVLAVNADVPANDIHELIELAKNAPGTMFYGTSSGAGGSHHLAFELFRLRTGIDIRPVHYSGGTTLMPDFLNNEIQMAINGPAVVQPYIAEGRLRPLLVIGQAHIADYPDVPLQGEAGLPDLESTSSWVGLHAPKDTPPEIVSRLNEILAQAVQTERFEAQFANTSAQPGISAPEQFSERIVQQHAILREVVEETNLTLD